MDAQLREDIAGFLDGRLRAGYRELDDELIDDAIDMFSDGGAGVDIDQLGALVKTLAVETVARLPAEQATWPATTDCDRLDAAFAELAANGFAAKQDFTCCGTCGAAEIGDTVEDFAATTSFVFFHQQDTEGAVEFGNMYMSYGSFAEGREPSIAAGHKVVEVLARHGLKVQWDGSIKHRIHVTIDWKRRFIPEPADN